MLILILFSFVLLTPSNTDVAQDAPENIEPVVRTIRYLRGAKFLPFKIYFLLRNYQNRLKNCHSRNIRRSKAVVDTRESQIPTYRSFETKFDYFPLFVDFTEDGKTYRIFYTLEYLNGTYKINIKKHVIL